MVRVVTFNQDGVSVKLAAMSWAEAEKFSEEGKAMLTRADVANEEWLNRTLSTVCNSLNRAGGDPKVAGADLKDTYDLPTINAMYLKVLEMSGLRAGEAVAATPVSPISEAA